EPPCALTLPTNIVSIAARLRQEGYATAHFGKWHLDWKSKSTPRDHGFDTVFEFVGHSIPGQRQEPPTSSARRAADYLAERAIEFIESNRQKPFFIYLCPSAV